MLGFSWPLGGVVLLVFLCDFSAGLSAAEYVFWVFLFGCMELLVSVLEHSLVVVGRLYFRPWVVFVMLRV
jgi:hypothetical protein